MSKILKKIEKYDILDPCGTTSYWGVYMNLDLQGGTLVKISNIELLCTFLGSFSRGAHLTKLEENEQIGWNVRRNSVLWATLVISISGCKHLQLPSASSAESVFVLSKFKFQIFSL